MILHWSPRSPFVRKVMVCAYECGLVDRLEKVRSVTHMLEPNPRLMQLNPWNKIPTMVTDQGQVLFDSDVICEYLDSMHAGTPLHPVEPALRWQALRWRAFGSEMLDVLILWRNERGRPPAQQLSQLLEVFGAKMNAGLAMLEKEASVFRGAPFNIGHVAMGCALGYVDFRFPDLNWRAGHPQLSAWQAEFERRPSARHTRPDDDLPPRDATGRSEG